jgi:hypothetical protein
MKTQKFLMVKTEMVNGKVNTYIFSLGTTFQEILDKCPVLKTRKILSAEEQDCEVLPYGKSGKKFQIAYTDLITNENGKIIDTISYSNPNDDELMAITPRDVAEMEGNEIMLDFYESLDSVD